MTNLLLAIAGILNGLVYVINKRLTLSQYHPAAYTALIKIVATIIALPILSYQFQIPSSISYWLLAIISIGTYGVGVIFGFKAYQSIDASVVALINRFKIIFTALIGLMFLSEHYHPKSFLGLGLILFGALLVVYDEGKFTLKKGIGYALLMTICYGLAAVMDKILLNYFSAFTYIFFSNFIGGLIFAQIPQARKEAIHLFKAKTMLVLTSAALGVIAWLIFLIVLQKGSLSTVYPIYDSMALIATVGAGILWLKETQRLPQKIFGAISVIAGIFLLG